MNNYEQHAFGGIESKKDLRDYKLSNVAMAVSLPDEFEVEHSEIKNQGQVCSCVAFSVAETLEAINENKEKYSTNWIYGYRPFGYYKGKGMMIRQALNTILKLGYVLQSDFSGNTEVKAVIDTVDEHIDQLKEKAGNRKIYAYAKIRNRDELKRILYLTKHPVVILVHCVNPFVTDENNIIQYSDVFSGYHAMVCYGWNELGLLLQNSWGDDWGNSGTAILSDIYPLREAWFIADEKSSYMVVKPRWYWLRSFVQRIKDIFSKNDF